MDLLRHALLNEPDTARRMIEEGIDINMIYINETNLQFAVRKINLRPVQLLLELGADRTHNYEQYFFISVLFGAVHKFPKEGGSYDIVKLLLETGSDCNEREVDGTAPLLYTLSMANLKCAKLLLEHGADIRAVSSDGSTALHYAAMSL